jgi:hypothetical protein
MPASTYSIRIDTLDGDSIVVATTYFFAHQAEAGQVTSPVPWSLQRNQADEPYFTFLQGGATPKRVLSINFRVDGDDVLNALRSIRDHILNGNGNLVRVYPIYRDDSSYYVDCFVDFNDIPDKFYFSGFRKAGDIITINFYEA